MGGGVIVTYNNPLLTGGRDEVFYRGYVVGAFGNIVDKLKRLLHYFFHVGGESGAAKLAFLPVVRGPADRIRPGLFLN